MALVAHAADVKVQVQGLQAGDTATVSLGSATRLATCRVAPDDREITFSGIDAGEYAVKIEISGYNIPETQNVVVRDDGSVEPMSGIKLVVTKREDEADTWHHTWEQDQSQSGYVTTSHVTTPPTIEFLGKAVVPSDVPAMARLYEDYHILLCDEGEVFTQEHAYRLLETMRSIDNDASMAGGVAYSKFILTNSHLGEDLTIEKVGDGQIVTLSQDAFDYANPFLVSLDGVRGRFFSKRLHHALVNFYTDMGRDQGRVNEILHRRYGCEILNINYASLTAGITNETEQSFQPFRPSEGVAIINMLEELPEGFHSTPHLKYLIRRKDGVRHPLHPEAAAVSWCVDNGYIEFMESAFGGNNVGFDTQRLILHEKTHFLWAFVFSDEIKNDWIELGGWYPDPNSASEWSTTKDAESVSAYAHQHTPNEDMAESVAYYLKNPEKLTAISPDKYAFIRDRIMHGTRYISHIPDHLTFEVLNLFPDYDFPGKIRRLDINAKGAPEEDKVVTVEVELQHMEGCDDGAKQVYTVIYSPKYLDTDGNMQYYGAEITLYPVDGNDHLLRGSVTISKYCKTGYWYARDLRVTNTQGLERFEGRDDCVWNLYINNPLEDIVAPKFIKESMQYILTDTIVEGRPSQNLEITFEAKDEHLERAVLRLVNDVQGSGFADRWGSPLPGTNRFSVNYIIPDYYPTSDYYLNSLEMYDEAGNGCRIDFCREDLNGPQQKIHITTSRPDTIPPTIDLNRISIYAEPTHPEAPDGETKVTIHFYCRDDISGEETGRYTLRDPQGTDHSDWMQIPCTNDIYFAGDPMAWRHKVVNIMLPQGSVPGIWGLAQLDIHDKALNCYIYNFVETMIFEPDDNTTDYVLFAEMSADTLNFYMSSEDELAVKFGWRVINEETGVEITGGDSTSRSATRSASGGTFSASVDLSGQPAGSYIVVATAMDADGKPLAVKSARVNKGETGIGKTTAGNLLEIETSRGTMTLKAAKPMIVPICDVAGRKVATVITGKGSTTIRIPAGIYIVAGEKHMVR